MWTPVTSKKKVYRKCNAVCTWKFFSGSHYCFIHRKFMEARSDSSTRVIVIQGERTLFCFMALLLIVCRFMMLKSATQGEICHQHNITAVKWDSGFKSHWELRLIYGRFYVTSCKWLILYFICSFCIYLHVWFLHFPEHRGFLPHEFKTCLDLNKSNRSKTPTWPMSLSMIMFNLIHAFVFAKS